MNPIEKAITTLTLDRFAWAESDLRHIRRCREIDRLNGIIWADEARRERGRGNSSPSN